LSIRIVGTYARTIIYYTGWSGETVIQNQTSNSVCSSKYYKQGVDSNVIDTKICKIWILKIAAKKSFDFKIVVFN